MITHPRFLLLSTVVLLLVARPLESATSSAPVKPDFSDPKKAASSFLAAVDAHDDAAIRNALIIAPEQKSAVEVFLQLASLKVRLQKAAEKQFGAAAASYFSSSSPLPF